MNKTLLNLSTIFIVLCIASCANYQKYIPNTTKTLEKSRVASKSNQTSNSTYYSKQINSNQQDQFDLCLTGIVDRYSQENVQALEKEVFAPDVSAQNGSTPVSELTNSTGESTDEQDPDNVVSDLEFVLDIRETKAMQKYFYYYTKKKRKTFQRWLKRAEPYLPYVKKVFQSEGLPLDLIFLPFAESGFNPWAYSNAGAAGMWQFIPGTARNYGLQVNWWLDERRNPYKSTRAAAKHLKRLYTKFDNWYLVLAAYNTGEYHIQDALRKTDKSNYFHLSQSTNLLYYETRMYVPKFMAILKIIKNLEKLGFDSIDWDGPTDPNKLKIDGGTDLFALCKSLGWDWSTFRHKNPFFKRRMSPPQKELHVYLPQKLNKQARKFLDKPSSSPYADYKRYEIRHGDSWWALSQRFQVPVRILKNINNKSSNHLRPGQSVLVPATAMQVADSQREDDNYIYNRKYTVKKGDNLWSIARKFDLSLNKLRAANNIGSSSLHIGEKLIIPVKSSTAEKKELARKRSNYKVQKGDSLWDISKRFGLSISTLKQANGITGNQLRAGTKIYIPDISRQQTRQAKQKAESAHSNIVKYIVKEGDNLWNIAQKFGVSHSKLLSWNNISRDEIIHPGDKLNIHLR